MIPYERIWSLIQERDAANAVIAELQAKLAREQSAWLAAYNKDTADLRADKRRLENELARLDELGRDTLECCDFLNAENALLLEQLERIAKLTEKWRELLQYEPCLLRCIDDLEEELK